MKEKIKPTTDTEWIVWHWQRGLTPRQIAKAIGWTTQAVRTRLSQLRQLAIPLERRSSGRIDIDIAEERLDLGRLRRIAEQSPEDAR